MDNNKRSRYQKLDLYNTWADELGLDKIYAKDDKEKSRHGCPDLINGSCSESIKIGSRNKRTEYK